jgi:hypothetical protein
MLNLIHAPLPPYRYMKAAAQADFRLIKSLYLDLSLLLSKNLREFVVHGLAAICDP